MPNEGEENDSGQRDQALKGWHSQVRQGRNQRRHGNRGTDQQRGRQTRFEGREPRLQGHIYDWTGSDRLNDTLEQPEKSAPTSESYTPSTWQTLQQPWTPWS